MMQGSFFGAATGGKVASFLVAVSPHGKLVGSKDFALVERQFSLVLSVHVRFNQKSR
ncbi:TPA: hypothetical protein ACVO4S_004845 [Vibrio diabolicus]